MTIQFGILHNPKTGGTTLKALIDQQNQIKPLSHIAYFDHAMTLPLFTQHYPNAQAIFFVREPLSRFVSGFYSRQRQGQPRYHYPWSHREARAFTIFKTPNELAESLSSINLLRRYRAIRAMKSIRHVRDSYRTFLGSIPFLNSIATRIAFIGHQPDFNNDLQQLLPLLSLDPNIQPPTDPIATHRNPAHLDPTLSPKAVANLVKWYHADIAIYQWCLALRHQRQITPCIPAKIMVK